MNRVPPAGPTRRARTVTPAAKAPGAVEPPTRERRPSGTPATQAPENAPAARSGARRARSGVSAARAVEPAELAPEAIGDTIRIFMLEGVVGVGNAGDIVTVTETTAIDLIITRGLAVLYTGTGTGSTLYQWLSTAPQTLSTAEKAQVQANLGVSGGGGSAGWSADDFITTPEVYDRFDTGKTAGAINGQAALTGQVYVSTGVTPMVVVASPGVLTDTDTTSGARAGYTSLATVGDITYMGADFAFSAGNAANGSLGIIAFPSEIGAYQTAHPGQFPPTGCHLVTTATSWIYSVIDSTGIIAIATGTYTTPLVQDGATRYSIEAVIDRAARCCYLRLPDGSTAIVGPDNRIAVTARSLCLEDYYTDATTGAKARTFARIGDSKPIGYLARTAQIKNAALAARPRAGTIANRPASADMTGPYTDTATHLTAWSDGTGWYDGSGNRVGNLLSADESRFATDTADVYAFTNCTVARSTTQVESSEKYSLEVTATAAGDVAVLIPGPGSTDVFHVTATKVYSVQLDAKPQTTARSISLAVLWYDEAGDYVAASAATVTAEGSGWTVIPAANLTAPNTPLVTTRGYMQIVISGCAAGEKHNISKVSAVQSATPAYVAP